jgi:nicotinate-nucleotide adenylyltransferase
MGKIAIFGGTFNPVHWGHLRVAECALATADLDRVVWVPSDRPSHKPNVYETLPHRLAMVERAIAGYTQFEGVAIVTGDRPSFAITTLRHLQTAYPNQEWFWVLGWDAFQTVPKWYGYHELVDQCTWLVAPRPLLASTPPASTPPASTPPASTPLAQPCLESLDGLHPDLSQSLRWQWLPLSPLAYSSSYIRQHWSTSSPMVEAMALSSWPNPGPPPPSPSNSSPLVRQWVPPAVADYIDAHSLYIASPTSGLVASQPGSS